MWYDSEGPIERPPRPGTTLNSLVGFSVSQTTPDRIFHYQQALFLLIERVARTLSHGPYHNIVPENARLWQPKHARPMFFCAVGFLVLANTCYGG